MYQLKKNKKNQRKNKENFQRCMNKGTQRLLQNHYLYIQTKIYKYKCNKRHLRIKENNNQE